MNARTLLSRLQLLGVVACGALAVGAIALDDRQVAKLLASVAPVTQGSVLWTIALLAWRHPRARGYARAAVVTTAMYVAGLAIAPWMEISEVELNLVLSASTLAVTSAHLVLIAQIDLAARYRWTWPAVLGCDALAAAFTLSAIWTSQPDLLSRLLAAMIVTAAGLSGAMLVLQRASREGAGPLGAVQPVAFCPGCGMSLRYPAGEIVCHRCDRGFFVAERARVKPPHAIAIA